MKNKMYSQEHVADLAGEYKEKEYNSSEMKKLADLYSALEELRNTEIAQELSLDVEEMFISVDECIEELVKRSKANENAFEENL